MFLEPEHTWRHVHGFTRKSEQQSQDFRAIAFIFFTRANRRITPHTTLPYRIGDFSLSWLSLGERKVGKEEQVDECIDEFLCERLGLFKVGCLVRLRVVWVALIKQNFRSVELASSAALPARAPKELVLPGFEMVGLVDKGKDPCEDAYAIQRIAFRGEFGVGEGRVVAQHAESRGDGKDEGFQVRDGVVAGTADIGG